MALTLEPPAGAGSTLTRLQSPRGSLRARLEQIDGVIKGTVEAGAFDLRAALEASAGGGKRMEPLPPLDLKLSAAELMLGSRPLRQVTAEVRRNPKRFERVEIRAQMAQGGKLQVDYQAPQETGTLAVRAENAGHFLASVAQGNGGVTGGRFLIDATVRETPQSLTAEGEAKLREFTLVGAPLLARIVTLASFGGLGNALAGQGIPIQRVVIPFRLENRQLIVTHGRMVGAQIGARADGRIDLDKRTIELDGTVAPAYTINQILASVPILGQIMAGEKGVACLAATSRSPAPWRHRRSRSTLWPPSSPASCATCSSPSLTAARRHPRPATSRAAWSGAVWSGASGEESVTVPPERHVDAVQSKCDPAQAATT